MIVSTISKIGNFKKYPIFRLWKGLVQNVGIKYEGAQTKYFVAITAEMYATIR